MDYRPWRRRPRDATRGERIRHPDTCCDRRRGSIWEGQNGLARQGPLHTPQRHTRREIAGAGRSPVVQGARLALLPQWVAGPLLARGARRVFPLATSDGPLPVAALGCPVETSLANRT